MSPFELCPPLPPLTKKDRLNCLCFDDSHEGEFWVILHRSFCKYVEASPDNVARSLQVQKMYNT